MDHQPPTTNHVLSSYSAQYSRVTNAAEGKKKWNKEESIHISHNPKLQIFVGSDTIILCTTIPGRGKCLHRTSSGHQSLRLSVIFHSLRRTFFSSIRDSGHREMINSHLYLHSVCSAEQINNQIEWYLIRRTNLQTSEIPRMSGMRQKTWSNCYQFGWVTRSATHTFLLKIICYFGSVSWWYLHPGTISRTQVAPNSTINIYISLVHNFISSLWPSRKPYLPYSRIKSLVS